MKISESPPNLPNFSFYGNNRKSPLSKKFTNIKPPSFKKGKRVPTMLGDGEPTIGVDLGQLKCYMDMSLSDKNHSINPFHATGFLHTP